MKKLLTFSLFIFSAALLASREDTLVNVIFQATIKTMKKLPKRKKNKSDLKNYLLRSIGKSTLNMHDNANTNFNPLHTKIMENGIKALIDPAPYEYKEPLFVEDAQKLGRDEACNIALKCLEIINTGHNKPGLIKGNFKVTKGYGEPYKKAVNAYIDSLRKK